MKRYYSRGGNPAATAWLAVGGLVALGLTMLLASEFPSVRRELRILRM